MFFKTDVKKTVLITVIQFVFIFIWAQPGVPFTKWTADGNALIYMTENDSTLSIIKQSLGDKPPETMAKFDQNDLFDFDYSADGQFAVTRGVWKWDVVLINNLNQ